MEAQVRSPYGHMSNPMMKTTGNVRTSHSSEFCRFCWGTTDNSPANLVAAWADIDQHSARFLEMNGCSIQTYFLVHSEITFLLQLTRSIGYTRFESQNALCTTFHCLSVVVLGFFYNLLCSL
jgi:hypothetical protein